MTTTFLLIFLFFFGWIWLVGDDGLLNINNPVVKYHFKEFWSRSFDFNGKTNRIYFWKQTLIYTFISLTIYIISLSVYQDTRIEIAIYFLPTIFFFISIIPSLSIQIRRLRDVGVAPFLVLLNLIPIVNLVVLFWYLQPSNSYKKNTPKSILGNEEMRLEELKSMLDRDVISEEEYKSMRKKTLGI